MTDRVARPSRQGGGVAKATRGRAMLIPMHAGASDQRTWIRYKHDANVHRAFSREAQQSVT
jgi:hypothetical protein